MDEFIDDHPRFADAQRHFHDLYRSSLDGIGQITEIAASPDGAFFAVTTTAFQKQLGGWPSRRIALLDATSGRLDLLPSAQAAFQPQFSPDGSRLAFLSDHAGGGVQQLHLRSVREIAKIDAAPHVDGTVESFSWSRDGRRVLVLTAALGADRASAHGSGPLVETGSSWRPRLDRRGASDGADTWRSLWIWTIGDDAMRRVTNAGCNVWEAAWCGDDAIVALCSDRPHEGAWYDARLQRLGLDGAVSASLPNPHGDQLGTPCASPDGSSIAVISAICSDRTVVAGDVVLFTPARDAAYVADLGGVQVTQIAWTSESVLFFIGFVDFVTVAGTYDVATGNCRELWRSGENCTGGTLGYPRASLLRDGAFVTLLESYKRPPTPVVVRNGEMRVLYEPTDTGLASIAAANGRLEELRWAGRDGLEIQGYLATPAGEGPHPLVVLVHGGPVFAFRNSWSMSYIFTPLLVRHGYAVLHPNPRGSAGRSRDYASLVRGDMGGEDAFDIIRGVETLIARGTADPARVATMGRSYGGYMSAWTTSRSDLFAASIAMNCAMDWYSRHFTSNAPEFQQRFLPCDPLDLDGPYFERSVLQQVRRIKTPTLLVAGSHDLGSPPAQGLMVHRALVEEGVASAYVAYPEEGHHVRRLEAQIDLCARCLIWLDRYAPARSP